MHNYQVAMYHEEIMQWSVVIELENNCITKREIIISYEVLGNRSVFHFDTNVALKLPLWLHSLATLCNCILHNPLLR